MGKKRYIVIGSGPAGISVAKVIGRKAPESEVIVIGNESYPPYSPTILPYFISGKIEERNVFLINKDDFRDLKINLILGNRVSSISPKEEKVFLENGSSFHYDHLFIASGGEPVIPEIRGLKESRPFVLRTMDDAKRLKKKVKISKKAIVLGAGLIGMQVSQALSDKGISIHVIEMMDQILPGYFDKEASVLIQKVYESHKVKFLISTEVKEVEFKKGEYHVVTNNGQTLHAPVLIVATGVSPRIDYLEGSGIEVDRGVLVDKFMRTNIPNIYAAGDVVQAEEFWGERRINQPILINAIDQGRVAAQNALGEKVSYEGNVSMNIFHFFENRAISIGITNPLPDHKYSIYKVEEKKKRKYLKFVFNEENLVGVMGINIDLDPGILLQLIRRRISFAREKREFIKKPLEVGRKLMCQNWR